MRNKHVLDGIMRMDRVREVLRLKEQGFGQREIHPQHRDCTVMYPRLPAAV